MASYFAGITPNYLVFDQDKTIAVADTQHAITLAFVKGVTTMRAIAEALKAFPELKVGEGENILKRLRPHFPY